MILCFMRLYLDTNVIVDVLENRNLSSYDLILRSLRCQHTLVISSWTLAELSRIGYGEQANALMRLFEESEKVAFVQAQPRDREAARDVSTHYADALHYVLARRSAHGLVTGNTKDFPFVDIPIGKPEDF